VKTSDSIRGASLFTRAMVAPDQSVWLRKTFMAHPLSPVPCPASYFAKRSPSLRAHRGTKENADQVNALPAPAVASPPQLFQTEGGVVFGCIEGGSKPECLSCPFYKSLELSEGTSTFTLPPGLDNVNLVPPDIDDLDDATSDTGFDNQLLARTSTGVFCTIEILMIVLLGFFMGSKVVAAFGCTTGEELSALSGTTWSRRLTCPLLLSGPEPS
jgi:hypothetical protein